METVNPKYPASPAGYVFPQTVYVQWTWREDANVNSACGTQAGGYCGALSLFNYYTTGGGDPGVSWQEWDWMEVYAGGFNTSENPTGVGSIHNVIGNFNGLNGLTDYTSDGSGSCTGGTVDCSRLDLTQPHTFAIRVVSDGGTAAGTASPNHGYFSYCAWLDGTFKGCNHGPYSNNEATGDIFNFREVLAMSDLFNIYPGAGGSGVLSAPFIGYLYNLSIWSCPNWISNPAPTQIPGRRDGTAAELGNNCLNSTADVTGKLTTQ
jgi:hypothetical protein